MSSHKEPFAPAGWYQDPLGLPQLRWWNGMMWTDRIEVSTRDIEVSTPYRIERVNTQ